ncbi:MAG: hypothetical protein HGB04_02225 [Chlorobiaceae bacterium]|nr:hypothetical protein [Chlorobiaceae bacterium]
MTAPVASPTLFTTQGLPAYVKGLPLMLGNLFGPVKHDVAIGCSHGTKIIYNGAEVSSRPERKDRKILFSFDGVSEGEVVGSITIQSRKNAAEEVDIPTLIYDAGRYVGELKELRGYDITLLSIPTTVTFMQGVDTRTHGVAASPYVSGFVDGPGGALVGVVPSVSKSGGVSVPTAVIGCTFLVLVDGERSRRVDIRPSYMPAAPSQVPAVGQPTTEKRNSKQTIRKKKFEAERQK